VGHSGGGARAGGRALRRTGPPPSGLSFEIPVDRFDLDLVVRSHGWYDLPPFRWDAAAGRLAFVFLEGERPIAVEVLERKGDLIVHARSEDDEISFFYAAAADAAADRRQSVTRSVGVKSPRPLRGARSAPLTPADRVQSVVFRVLDLSADLSEFHAVCRAREVEGFGWIERRGAGRMLRAPALFEDAVKVLLTTNCSWGLTRATVGNLVSGFDRGGAFPDAPFIAGFPEGRLRGEIRCGYRAPYLLSFSEAVASGRLDLSRWEEADRPDDEVEAEIAAQPGFGSYAVQTLSRLLGRHAKLGLDSWSRHKAATLRFRGRRVPDARIEGFYRPFGRWAGLAFWLDVTRQWHDGTERLWP
jgi:3-methyladenine DNA glycosylase/8-oxoguanine DNA glycosylase